MVCSCGDLCTCKGHCTCSTGYCTCSVCHGKNICNHCPFPLCEATLAGSKDKKKFCQCLQTSKVTRSHSTTSFKIAKDSAATSSVKPKNFESDKNPITHLSSTPYYSSFNVSITSENEEAKISTQGQPHRSLFGSLKLKMRKISSHFKKPKNKKTFHHANLSLERENEASGESSVETDSSTDTDYSLSKRTKSLKSKENCYSTKSLRQPSPKAGNVSFPSNHNLEETALAKPHTTTVKGETDAFFGKQLGKPTRISIDNKQSPRSRSSSSPNVSMYSYQSCFTPFRLKLPWLTVQNAENDIPSTWSKEIQNLKSPEDAKFSIINLKDSETSPIAQSPKTHRPTFFIGNVIKSRSTSDDDKSITIHLSSNSQEGLPSTKSYSSYFCTRPLRNNFNEGKNTELLNSSDETQTTILVETSRSISADLNEFPEPLKTSSIASASSSTSHELNETHRSCSLSRKPLLSSQSSSSSPCSTSLANFPGSFLELSLHENITLDNSNFEDKNLTDASTFLFVSSDLSGDFETLDIRSSPDSADSESISSSEFLPCSYCRFVAHTPLISDSIIPYEPLE